MEANVFIIGRRDGEVIYEYEGHNVWIDTGRIHLARLMSYSDPVAELPYEGARLKYMGFGIGSARQQTLGVANSPPLSVDYPGGYDPLLTSGNEYEPDYYLVGGPGPSPITTLERPVRISGGSGANAYDPPAPTDVWLKDPLIGMTIEGGTTAVLRAVVDTLSGDMVYGPYTQMPISEIGLFLSTADVNDPFNVVVPTPPDARVGTMVAYHAFATLLISAGETYEFIWKVKF
jgi:hypothetical protein